MTKSTTQFIAEANHVHNGKYDYSLCTYINLTTKATIVCPTHGQFSMRPGDHLHGKQGCRLCANAAKRGTTASFIERATQKHNGAYDYSQVKYVHSKQPVTIICKVHGPFTQKPNDHLNGTKCPQCAQNAPHTKDLFVSKARDEHGQTYDYTNAIYNGVAHKVVIGCPAHGPFTQTPTAHVDQGQGCPRCKVNNYSKEAILWLEYRSVIDGVEIQHAKRGGEFLLPSTAYKVDGYCKHTNTVYEFWGDFWHGNPKIYHTDAINKVKQKSFGELYNETMEKRTTIQKLGYNLVEIWEHDWYEFLRRK